MFKFFRKKAYEKRKEAIEDLKSKEEFGFHVGELVEVRSEKEIFNTLNNEGKLKGLRFTPEMREYCEKKFKIYKRLEKMLVEATGELRAIKTPTLILEGVICNGSAHGGCDRSCFIFWREEWLKKMPQNENVQSNP